MKLYATITSERASKGQGGNKELRIAILVGDKHNPKVIGTITLFSPDKENKNGLLAYNFYDVPNWLIEAHGTLEKKDTEINDTRAKRQKGEDYSNPRIAHKTHEHGDDWHD